MSDWSSTPQPRACGASRGASSSQSRCRATSAPRDFTVPNPFSVSSAPEADNITIVLKDLGDWTHALCELPSAFVPDGSKLRIDGPFGRLAVPVASYDAVLLCCGGIGCTPMMSVLGSIVARSKAGGKALREICFVWAVREAALVEYFMPLLIEAAQLPGCRIRVHRAGRRQ